MGLLIVTVDARGEAHAAHAGIGRRVVADGHVRIQHRAVGQVDELRRLVSAIAIVRAPSLTRMLPVRPFPGVLLSPPRTSVPGPVLVNPAVPAMTLTDSTTLSSAQGTDSDRGRGAGER